VTITASQAGDSNYGAATSISQTFAVGQASQTITFNNPGAQVYGATLSLAATASSGLTVTYAVASGPATVSGHTVTFTGVGAVTITASQAGNDNYTAATSVSQTFHVNKADQAITFNNPGTQTYGTPLTLDATASSGLAVTYAVASGAATVSDNIVTFTGTGSVTIAASQAGNANYNAASSVSQTFTVNPAPTTFTWSGGPTFTYDGSGKSVTASPTPGGATYAQSSTWSATNAGSYTATATANGNYTGSSSYSWTINKADQSITFSNPGAQTYGTTLTLAASASSGLAVSFSISSSGVATLSGNVLTFVGTGSVTVTASQTGNGNYNAASNVSQTFTVNPAPQTITFASPGTQTYGTPLTLSATASSGLAVSFAVASGPATVSGNIVTFTGTGAVTVTALQAGNTNYYAATNVSQTFTVNPEPTTFTWSGGPTFTYDGTSKSVTATPSPSEATYTQGGTWSATGAGSYTATATATGNYTGSSSYSWTINKADQSITFVNPGTQVYGTPLTLSSTASSGLPVSYAVTSGSATVSNNVVTFTGIGSVTITASQAGDSNYNAATAVAQTFTVNPKPVSFTFTNTSFVYTGSAQGPTINNTDNATYSTSGTPSATNAGSYSFTVTATGNYTGSNSCSWSISKTAATVTLSNLHQTYDGSSKTPTVSTSAIYAVAVSLTFDGSTTAPTDSGSYSVAGTISDTNYYGSVAGTFVIAKATATVTLGNLTHTYDGTAKTATATTSPAGKTVVITYDGSPRAPTAVGSYHVTGTVVDSNYVGSATGDLTIASSTAMPDGSVVLLEDSTTSNDAGNPSAVIHLNSYGVTAFSHIYLHCRAVWNGDEWGDRLGAASASVSATANGQTLSTSANGHLDEDYGDCPTADVELVIRGISKNSQGHWIAATIQSDGSYGPQGWLSTAQSQTNVDLGEDAVSINIVGTTSSPIDGTSSIEWVASIDLDTTAPTVPTNLYSGSPSGCTVSLQWTASSDNVGVTGYEVFCDGVSLGTVTGTSATVTVPTEGTSHVLQVRALDGAGNWSALSSSLTVEISDGSPPTAPSTLTLNAVSASSITMSWSASTDNVDVVGYKIYRGDTQVGQVTGLSFTDSGLSSSTTYTYTVVAYDAAGNLSASSPTLTAQTSSSTTTSDTDSDGDGMPDWWENATTLNPNDASDAAADRDGDGICNLDEYNRWGGRYNYDLTVVPVNVSVVAKGTGSVTVTATDENSTVVGEQTFSFSSGGSTWSETSSSTNAVSFTCNLGESYHLAVSSAGVSDYVLSAQRSPKTSPLLEATVELNGSYSDRILMSEISGGSVALRAVPAGSLPFGKMDDSKLNNARMITFGLGGSSSGQTAGRVLFTCGSLGGGAWRPALNIIKGPTLEWYHETPTHFQGRTPSGYVEYTMTRALWTIRYFSLGSYADGTGFNDFSAATPVATYTIAPRSQQDDSGAGMTLTRTAGGVTEVFEEEVGFTEVEDEYLAPQNSGDPAEEHWTVTGTEYHWGWRASGSSRGGMTKVVGIIPRVVLVYGSGPVTTYESPCLQITRYDGSTESSTVRSYDEQHYAAGDLTLQSKVSDTHGTGTDLVNGNARFTNATVLAVNPICQTDSIGGGTYTQYYSRSTSTAFSSNLDGQPVISYGEIKNVWQSFGDDPGFTYSPSITVTTANPVTTYTYGTDPVDGRAAVSQALTQKNSTTIGRTDYGYVSGTFNGQICITTTATAYADSTTSLATISKAYSRRLSDLDLRGKPISVLHPDGTQVSYAYQRGTLSGSTWSASTSGSDLLVAELNGKTGSAITAFNGISVDPLDMESSRSTVTERIVNNQGLVTREATYVYNGSGFSLVNAVYFAYSHLGVLLMKADQPISLDASENTSTSGRIFYQASYAGWRKISESDEQGVTFSYSYDNYGRVYQKTRTGASSSGTTIAAGITVYAYDGANRCLSETESASNASDTLTTSYTYDTANRLTSRTLPGGYTTSFAYSSSDSTAFPYSHNVTTTTFPDGGTKVETLYRDGTKKSVTGTAVPDVNYTCAFDGSGFRNTTETLTTGQSTVTACDWLGRTRTVSSATYSGGTRVVTSNYNSYGQLANQDTTSGSSRISPTHLFSYDTYGRLLRDALDANSNGSIDLSSDFGIKEYEFSYQQGAPGCSTSDWYLYEGQKIWPYDGAKAESYRYASQSYTQLSGLTAGTVGHAVALDFDRNRSEATSTLARSNKQLTVNTVVTGSTQTVQAVTLNGLVVSSTNAQGQTTSVAYDGLSRKLTSTDPRIGATTFTYHSGTALVQWTTGPDGRSIGYGYDSAGRVNATVDPAGKTAYFLFNPAGNLLCQWGDTVNPVRYEYNDLGQKTIMHTYRSGNWTGSTRPSGFDNDGDVTTWNFQASTGLLVAKIDAANATFSYEYNSLGQMTKRTDARGWITNYAYNDLNLLQTVDYTDGVTTDIGRTYDRTGKVATVTDAAGQRTFAYYDNWTDNTYENELRNKSTQLKSETLPSGFFGSTNNVLNHDYQYQVEGRANGPSSSVMIGSGSAYSVSYGYDDVLRLNAATYNGGTPFVYSYVSGANLIDTVTQSGGYWRDYDYRSDGNRLDKVKHGWSTLASSATESRLEYDTVGRRGTEKTQGTGFMATLGRSSDPGVHVDYSYTDKSEVDSSGKYVLTPNWGVGSLLSGTDRDYAYDPIGNRDSTYGYSANALNQYTVAPGLGSFTYDANGNMTSDGVRTYTYDGENRLISVTLGGYTWSYVYDYLGRRIQKSGTGISTTKYLYDGWNLIAELDSSGNIQRRFAWGLDVSGSLAGAGGVGGLLLIDAGLAQYWPVYDASHNVVAIYDSAGGFAAGYEYDPFGNLQNSQGSYAAYNPFQFSTKYADTESGLVYFGMRYYSPQLGRFINRDPIEEKGGINLYVYCGNDGVNRSDYLGQDGEDLGRMMLEANEKEKNKVNDGDTVPMGKFEVKADRYTTEDAIEDYQTEQRINEQRDASNSGEGHGSEGGALDTAARVVGAAATSAGCPRSVKVYQGGRFKVYHL